MQINIPNPLADQIAQAADLRGVTPEGFVLALLESRLKSNEQSELPPTLKRDAAPTSEMSANLLGGFVGAINSAEIVTGGARMSEGIREKITESLMEKKQTGKL